MLSAASEGDDTSQLFSRTVGRPVFRVRSLCFGQELLLLLMMLMLLLCGGMPEVIPGAVEEGVGWWEVEREEMEEEGEEWVGEKEQVVMWRGGEEHP